jgi:hypothetical protein
MTDYGSSYGSAKSSSGPPESSSSSSGPPESSSSSSGHPQLCCLPGQTRPESVVVTLDLGSDGPPEYVWPETFVLEAAPGHLGYYFYDDYSTCFQLGVYLCWYGPPYSGWYVTAQFNNVHHFYCPSVQDKYGRIDCSIMSPMIALPGTEGTCTLS